MAYFAGLFKTETTAQKCIFPLRISSVNVTESAVWIWSHLLKKCLMENFIFVQ